MNPIKHPTNNDQLRPPEGVSEDDCRTLDITRLQQNVGGEILPVVVSFWRPEPVELAALNAGMPVFLHFWGRTHPPVAVGVEAQPDAPSSEAGAPSPTAGMTLEQRILHVGGRNNLAGYVEFGSTQAVRALVQQVLRDLPTEPAALQSQQDDGATNAAWLSLAHAICAENMIAPGHITQRLESLRSRLDEYRTWHRFLGPTKVITDAQITAGAAVADTKGKPIGRNVAIDVFHAMTDPSVAPKAEG